MRSTRVVLLVLLVLAGLAAAEMQYTVDNEPASGQYLDLNTLLIHEYDATTGALTPTTQQGVVAGFAAVNANSNDDGPASGCHSDLCFHGYVLLVGYHHVKYHAIVESWSGNVIDDEWFGPYSSETPVVTSNKITVGFNYEGCNYQLHVTQYVNGNPHDYSTAHDRC